MKIKRVLMLFAALLFIVPLAACQKNPNVNPGNKFEVDINIDYNTEGSLKIGITYDGREENIIKAAIAEYNNIYPNVTVTYEQIPENYNNNLVGMYGADTRKPGTMPDILMSNDTDMHPHISSGIFLNIQPYIDASVEAGKLDLADFYPEMWKLGKKSFTGDQYLIPRSSDRVVTHINKKIFNDCFKDTPAESLPFTPREGTKLPANGWTWQEFLDTCAALRLYYNGQGKSNLYIIDGYLNWEPVYNSIFLSNGVKYFGADGKTAIDSPETRKALGLINNLIDKKYTASFDSASQANYEGGQGAMLFHSAPASHYIASLGDDYDLTTFPLIGENPKIGTGVPGYAIYGRSPKRDLAWTFLNFLISEDGQEALAKGGMTVPPIRKDMADPAKYGWGKNYSGINMSAYTYGAEYCVPTEFFVRYSDMQPELTGSVRDLIKNASQKNSMETAMEKCVDDFDYYIGKSDFK